VKDRIELFDSFHIRQVDNIFFQQKYAELADTYLDPDYALSFIQYEQTDGPQPPEMQPKLVLNWLVYHQDEIIGWCHGMQLSNDSFYMKNSCIKPAFRNRGLYSKVLSHLTQHIFNLGFKVVTSKHIASNNAILIAKLKQGFIVTGMEMSVENGLLLVLSLFNNKIRHQVLDFRNGFGMPGKEVSSMLKQVLKENS
jgi:RimJ/RimL family protein N-acetyltransferase